MLDWLHQGSFWFGVLVTTLFWLMMAYEVADPADARELRRRERQAALEKARLTR